MLVLLLSIIGKFFFLLLLKAKCLITSKLNCSFFVKLGFFSFIPWTNKSILFKDLIKVSSFEFGLELFNISINSFGEEKLISFFIFESVNWFLLLLWI